MNLEMTLEDKNAILGDMVNVFQNQFDAIDEALGLATGPDDESSLQRTMDALLAIKNRQQEMLNALRKIAHDVPFPGDNPDFWKTRWQKIAAEVIEKYDGQPEKSAKTETAVPAIVTYPTGSLGEAIEAEGGAA